LFDASTSKKSDLLGIYPPSLPVPIPEFKMFNTTESPIQIDGLSLFDIYCQPRNLQEAIEILPRTIQEIFEEFKCSICFARTAFENFSLNLFPYFIAHPVAQKLLLEERPQKTQTSII
jgi:hypothetical protein